MSCLKLSSSNRAKLDSRHSKAGSNSPFLKSKITGGFTRVVNIGQLVRLYRHTGNDELIEFVRQVIQYYPPIQQMLSTGEPFLVHPYMLSAVLGGVLEFAEVTKDKDMKVSPKESTRDQQYELNGLDDLEGNIRAGIMYDTVTLTNFNNGQSVTMPKADFIKIVDWFTTEQEI